MRKKIRYYVLIIAGLIFIGNLISFILNPSFVSSPRLAPQLPLLRWDRAADDEIQRIHYH